MTNAGFCTPWGRGAVSLGNQFYSTQIKMAFSHPTRGLFVRGRLAAFLVSGMEKEQTWQYLSHALTSKIRIQEEAGIARSS